MRHIILWIAAAATVLLVGCPIDAPDTGSLELRFNVARASTIEPAVSMEIASYEVAGQGPGGASFNVSVDSAGSTTVESLVAGNWLLGVQALNADATVIAGGSTTATVTAGATGTVQITVAPLGGPGTLDIALSWWPTDMLTDPSVEASLAPDLATAGDVLSFTVGATSAHFRDENVPAGQYVLRLALYEGAGSEPVWGDAWSVRIVAGEPTNAVFDLTEKDIAPGSLSLEITPDLQNPFSVTFQGDEPALVPGTAMTVAATSDPEPSNPAYQWYLNGVPLAGETGNTITIGDSLDARNFRLSLIVQSGEVMSSAGFRFVVSEYARTPVFFVNGYNVAASVYDTMIAYLRDDVGFPSLLLRYIHLDPTTGANIPAAEAQIQPGIEAFLTDVNDHIAANVPGLPPKTKVDIVSYSMGGLSTRWYAAKLRPDRVRTWLSLSGANHGTDAEYFVDRTTGGSLDLYPAYAESEEESLVQYQLNGAPFVADVDETPYGLGLDQVGTPVVPPDELRRIHYVTISPAADAWVVPIHSMEIDGAGGVPFTIPGDLPTIELSPGNYQMTNVDTHGGVLSDAQSLRLVELILGLRF